jgi:hypothetical protein
MKAEISVPNPIFEAAQQLAQKLDMSLSELYTVAVAAYVATYQDEQDITQKLDEIYQTESSAIEPELVTLQVISIGDEGW